MKKQLWLFMLYLPLMLMAQDSVNTGIKWTTGLSWEQVKQKARTENKHIFVDVYATWCGPCKMMDKYVYLNDTVGDFFNEKFLSVKVQMDKTANDNAEVKKWYADADSIKKQYHIEGYPTFLFLDPNGQITEFKSGYKGVGELIALGKSATEPGRSYDDPYADYERKIAAYKRGERNYDSYPSMIITADKLGNESISKQLTKELTDYVITLPIKERYTKERIEFWDKYTWPSTSRTFGFFYNDAKLINKIMKRKSFSENFVDRTIQEEIVLPFLEEQAKGTGVTMKGMYLTGPVLKADSREVNWNHLYMLIRTKYEKDYAKRNILTARLAWYDRHGNKAAGIKYALIKFKKYVPEVDDLRISADINQYAWEAFLYSTNKKVLKKYSKLMGKAVSKHPDVGYWFDTYANLLYKLGNVNQAIVYQQKAVELEKIESYRESMQITLESMKKGEPTYVAEVNWEGINSVQWETVKFNKWIEVSNANDKPISGIYIRNMRTKELVNIKEGKSRAVISVSLGDTIEVSAPRYQSKEIVITKNNIKAATVTLNHFDDSKDFHSK